MDNQKLTEIIVDLATAGNYHPMHIMDLVIKMITGEVNATYYRLAEAVHTELFKQRGSLPWLISEPDHTLYSLYYA